MKIEKNKVVELCYELVVDGEVADKTTKERPLDYIHGTGMLLEKFEKNVEGLEPGGKFSFTLTPAEGYGEVDPDRIIDLLVPGTTVPLLNGRGQVIPGKVLEVSEKSVKMDLYSHMAGKTLIFSGVIVSVREATEKELKEGLHGENVHQCHCGGGHGEGCGHEGGCHGDGDGCCGHGEGHHEGGCCHDGEGHKEGCCGQGEGQHEGGCCHGEKDK